MYYLITKLSIYNNFIYKVLSDVENALYKLIYGGKYERNNFTFRL